MKNTLKKLFVLAFIFLMLLSSACTVVNPTPTETPQETATIMPTQGANTPEPTFDPSQNENYLPPFSAEQLDGETYSSTDFAQHKLTMINVWATWCGPCIGELDELGNIARDFESKGVTLIGILLDSDDSGAVEEAKQLLSSNNAQYRNIKLNETVHRTIVEKYNIYSIPTTLFVNSDGIVVTVVSGAKSYQEWSEIIDNLLEG